MRPLIKQVKDLISTHWYVYTLHIQPGYVLNMSINLTIAQIRLRRSSKARIGAVDAVTGGSFLHGHRSSVLVCDNVPQSAHAGPQPRKHTPVIRRRLHGQMCEIWLDWSACLFARRCNNNYIVNLSDNNVKKTQTQWIKWRTWCIVAQMSRLQLR